MNIEDDKGNFVPDNSRNSKRIVSGIMALLFGSLGIHKFILGYTKEGIILLAISLVTCGVGAAITGVIGFIEGIIYLVKSDEEFIYEYQINKRGWF